MTDPTMQTPITIDRDVPMPPRPGGTGRPRLYPFPEMEVGDSFARPYAKRAAISVAVAKFGRSSGCKFETRKVDDQVRVWRVA